MGINVHKYVDRIVALIKIKHPRTRKLCVYKPCMCFLHPDSEVVVKNHFGFNRQWDGKRVRMNLMAGSLFMDENARIKVESFDVYAGSRITVNQGAELSLGRGYMNYECVIECFSSISIGNDVAISERVVIRDSDNHAISSKTDNCLVRDKSVVAPIIIGDHVWIGMNVTVLKGVTIGEGAVVAAGSVVNKDVPSHCLVAGVPAKVVKTDIEWS